MERLIHALGAEVLGKLSPRTLRAIRVAFARLRPDQAEEMIQEILIGCWESKGARPLRDEDVLRAVWRARQRIHRSELKSKRHVPLGVDPPDRHDDIAESDLQAEIDDIERCLKGSLEELDIIFLEYCQKGLSVGEIARLHNLSQATVYRRIEDIKRVVRDILQEQRG